MKLSIAVTIAIVFFSTDVFCHSGGTDKDGCHAGSEPRHCHNVGGESIDLSAWDINFGYQFSLNGATILPYLGASVGERYLDSDTKYGMDIGLKFANGFYFGYVSTSESFQFGYRAIHLSVTEDLIGLGLRIPPDFNLSNKTSVYFSGSGLVDDGSEDDF